MKIHMNLIYLNLKKCNEHGLNCYACGFNFDEACALRGKKLKVNSGAWFPILRWGVFLHEGDLYHPHELK